MKRFLTAAAAVSLLAAGTAYAQTTTGTTGGSAADPSAQNGSAMTPPATGSDTGAHAAGWRDARSVGHHDRRVHASGWGDARPIWRHDGRLHVARRRDGSGRLDACLHRRRADGRYTQRRPFELSCVHLDAAKIAAPNPAGTQKKLRKTFGGKHVARYMKHHKAAVSPTTGSSGDHAPRASVRLSKSRSPTPRRGRTSGASSCLLSEQRAAQHSLQRALRR